MRTNRKSDMRPHVLPAWLAVITTFLWQKHSHGEAGTKRLPAPPSEVSLTSELLMAEARQEEVLSPSLIWQPGQPSLAQHKLANFENCCGCLFLR